MTALDLSIKQDLSDLYAGTDMAKAKRISSAIVSIGVPVHLSTKGCPTHYAGKRNAKTVFVNLNPGGDSYVNDCMFQQLKAKYNWKSLKDFTTWYHKKCQVLSGCNGVDVFDLKTAVFLSQWPNSGIAFPKGFPGDKGSFCCANEAALQQKLQLELLPYCSQTFPGFNKAWIAEFFPYLETVLEEIFECPREYVIFGSGKFEELFKAYVKSANRHYDIDLKKHPRKAVQITNNLKGNCQVIYLYDNASGKSQKAIIAHTFPSYALPNAHPLMNRYGMDCCDEYLNTHP